MNASPSTDPHRAQALMDLGRYQDALTILHQTLASDTKNANVLCQISYCYSQLGEYEKCLEFANQAIAAHPDDEWGYRLLSNALRLKRIPQLRDSVQAAFESVRLAPENAYTWHTLANAHLANGGLQAAMRSCEQLRQIAPEWASTYELLAGIALARKRYREAIKWIAVALRLDPSNAYSHNLLGCIHMKQMKYRSAMDAFMASVQLRPTVEVYRDNVVLAVDTYCVCLGFWRARYALLGLIIYWYGVIIAAALSRSISASVCVLVMFLVLVVLLPVTLVPLFRLRSLPKPIQQLMRTHRRRTRSLTVLYKVRVILVSILRLRSLPEPVQQFIRNHRKRIRSLPIFRWH